MSPTNRRPLPNVRDPLSESTAGRRMWAAREQRGINRKQLEKLSGVSYSAIDDWERGASEPTLASIRAVAAIVGYSVDELASGRSPTAGPVEGLDASIATVTEIAALGHRLALNPTEENERAFRELAARYLAAAGGYAIKRT